MPESTEAPPDTAKPPKFTTQQGSDPTWGNKFDSAFKKLTKPDEGESAKLDTPEAKTDEVKEATPTKEPEKTVEPTVEKPSSALEAALGETKPEEPAKPDELAEFDKVESPKSEDWKRARETMKRQRDELTQFRTAPKPADTNAEAIAKENAELKERLAKQDQNLKAINAEYSEEFQGLLGEREKVLNKVANKMKYSGSDRAEELVAALGMPEGKLKTTAVKDALSELDNDDRIAVRALLERLDEADEKISDFKKDLPAQFDRLKAQKDLTAREQAEKESKLQETQFQKVIEELPKEIIRLRQVSDDVTGAKEWNEPIRAAIDGALSALKPNGADFRQTVAIAVKGGLFDDVWNTLVSKDKELRAANARLKEFDEGSPDFKGGKAPSGKGEKKVAATGEDYERAYHQNLNAASSAGVGP